MIYILDEKDKKTTVWFIHFIACIYFFVFSLFFRLFLLLIYLCSLWDYLCKMLYCDSRTVFVETNLTSAGEMRKEASGGGPEFLRERRHVTGEEDGERMPDVGPEYLQTCLL